MQQGPKLTIGIMQPYFMPYIGYWQLMKAVDKYVVYDDVNYIKGGWVARNNILMNGEKKMFVVKLNGASSNKQFKEITIADNFLALQKTLQHTYHNDKILSNFIMNSFREVLTYLDIHTELILSSTIAKDNTLRGQDKVLAICKELGAVRYLNAIGGQELYSKKIFAQHGVELYFVETLIMPYNQLAKGEFVPNLSLIDVLMNNSPEDINRMLDNYKLI